MPRPIELIDSQGSVELLSLLEQLRPRYVVLVGNGHYLGFVVTVESCDAAQLVVG